MEKIDSRPESEDKQDEKDGAGARPAADPSAEKPEAGTRSGKGEGREDLDRAFLVKAAVYAGELSAGLGVKLLNREPLASELAEPGRRGALKDRVMRRIGQALDEAGVTYGVDGEAIADAAEAFLQAADQGSGDMITRKAAQGEEPEPGEDGRLEYPLNPDNLPMHRVEEVPETSGKRWYRMVHKGDTLVQAFPPKPGKAGRSVKGEPVEPKAKPKEVSLASAMGANTAVEGDRLIAECDGVCEENAKGRVRVVPEVVLEAVDVSTGSFPEAGVSGANVLVKGDIRSEYGVASSENLFVGGIVQAKTRVSVRNLVVKGTVFGKADDAGGGGEDVLDAQEVCVAGEVEGRSVAAQQILVAGNCRFARLSADEAVRVDGNFVGGQAACRGEVTVAGDMGTEEGGSRTRVVVPPAGSVSRQQKRLALALHRQKKAVADLREGLNRLEATASKRAEADPYWSALMSGELRRPGSPMEAKALRQFKDLVNERKRLDRSIKEERLALAQLQEEAASEAEASEAPETCVKVAGRLFLDVSFEVTAPVEEEALELSVTYSIEGKRFRNHTLNDIRSELSKQARAYLEVQSSQVEERRQAIEQMFKDAENRPSAPQVKHKRFELPFVWSEEGEGGQAGILQVATTALVDTSEAGRLYVRTVATAGEVLEGVAVTLSQEGPRVGFSFGSCKMPEVRWQGDADVLQALEGIVFRGLSAPAFLEGAEIPEGAG